MVKLYDRTVALLKCLAALQLETESVECQELIIEAREILSEIKKVS